MKWRDYKFLPLLAILLLGGLHAMSQSPNYQKTRILFVLDASGSMEGQWKNRTKFEVAKEILIEVLDSVYAKNKNVEFGLRLFGHQSPRDEKNCEDTRLEIPFGKNNLEQFERVLSEATPQGQTPIAYSLFQAINDFPDDPGSKNVVILITDGLESCEGNPCAVAPLLSQNHIALRPFVIGLGLELENEDYFDCIGKFLNANDKPSLENVMNVVISQAMNNTTAEIRLVDAKGQARLYNIPVSIYNQRSKKLEKVLITARGYKGESDTIYLSPVSDYDIIVHTTPEIIKKGVSLEPGRHNIIAIDAPIGYLQVNRQGFRKINDVQCVVKNEKGELLSVFNINNFQPLLQGRYYIEILTLPRVEKQINIKGGETYRLEIPAAGRLTVNSSRVGIYSIYKVSGGRIDMIYENRDLRDKETLQLQPGEYLAVFRQYKYKSSKLTKSKKFNIRSGSATSIWF